MSKIQRVKGGDDALSVCSLYGWLEGRWAGWVGREGSRVGCVGVGWVQRVGTVAGEKRHASDPVARSDFTERESGTKFSRNPYHLSAPAPLRKIHKSR